MAFFIFLIGLCVGSLVNVLADRLPRGEDVIWGRSHCDYCGKTLRWYELIPVVSYVVQRGKCLRCRGALSIQYPIVELTTALALVYLSNVYLCILFVALLVLFLADLKTQILPDSMIFIGMLASLGYILTSGLPIVPHIASAVFTSLGFYFLWAATRGRGMGFGDVKLAYLLGLFLGFPLIIGALYVAFLTGAAVGVILILTGAKGLKSKIAFGPFLIFGLVGAYLWQNELILLWQRFI